MTIVYRTTLVLVATVFLAGCFHAAPEPQRMITKNIDTPEYIPLEPDELALALLTPEDVAEQVSDVRPAPVEFNDQLDPNLANYAFYLGRIWNGTTSHTMVLSNAITSYTSVAAAQANVAELTADCTVAGDNAVGDTSFICYTEPLLYYGGPSDPAVLTYRFTVGQYGVRLDVTDTGDFLDSNTVIQDRLTAIAYRLARAQEARLLDVLSQLNITLPDTLAIRMLPAIDAEVLGTAEVTMFEWLALTADDRLELEGFVSGALRRWQLPDRPDEVIEVTVLEFASAEQAAALRDELVHDGDEVITLPESLEAMADAVVIDTLVELQAAQDNWFYDITVFAPFAETDIAAATADVISFSETILQSPNVQEVTTVESTVTADTLATGLLNDVDVLGALYGARPQVVEFNGRLDGSSASEVDFFVARQWWDEVSGQLALQNAITKFTSDETAQEHMWSQAADFGQLKPDSTLGDDQVVYYEPATEDAPAGVTYRFTVGQYGVRLTMLAVETEEFSNTDVDEYLLPTAVDLAKIQYDKLTELLSTETIALLSNTALEHLPATVAGGQLLGTATVNYIEWLGTTYDLEADEFPEYSSGGLRRWQLTERPAEVVEVVVVEMTTAEAATSFVADLVPSSPEAEALLLPATLDAVADGIDSGDLLEIQMAQGNYIIDVSVFAPFGEVDAVAARADIVFIAETIAAEFEE